MQLFDLIDSTESIPFICESRFHIKHRIIKFIKIIKITKENPKYLLKVYLCTKSKKFYYN